MSEFNQNAIKQLNRITAQKIFEKMRILRMSPTENSKRRWIWELLQNAKDKAAIDFPDQQVSVAINLTENNLEFKHNFGYFTSANIEGIIRQISSEDKDREDQDFSQKPQTTGRFGTGFMTTHLLSEKVEVEGIYQIDNQQLSKISFLLDRSGRSLPELIESINYSFECAEKSLDNNQQIFDIDFSQLNTVFTYKIDNKGKEIAEIGLNDLEVSLPYTLIFIDRIKYVEVVNNDTEIIYEKKSPQAINEQINLIEFDKITNGNLEKIYYIYLSKNLTTIALQIELENEQISLKSLNQQLPRLFLDFPLIGTENFFFSVVINNPFLEPTEPRDGVFLTDANEEHIIKNKAVFQDAIDLYLIIVDYATNNDWQNLYFLADTKLPSAKDWLSQNWYKENVQKVLRDYLMQSEIVYTDDPNNPKIKLKDALFPYHKSFDQVLTIWNFAQELWFDRLPKEEHLQFWHKIIDKTWSKELHYDLTRLMSDLASYTNVSQLADRINKTEAETLKWLTEFIKFVHKENEQLLDKFAIIPNQYGDFKFKQELWLDENIPNQLKDVLKILNIDWRINLKHNQIEDCDLTITKNLTDIVNTINKIIKDGQNSQIQTAVLHLISCSPPNNKSISLIYETRKNLWQFAKDFYRQTPEQKYLANWNQSIWEECDQWLIKKIFEDIKETQNIFVLINHLQQDAYQWLSNLINFIVNNNIISIPTNSKILPDQHNNFVEIKHLFLDDNIDEVLKDIVEDLGYDCRSELINQSINLESDIIAKLEIKKKNLKDITREITERVNNILKNEGLDQGRDEKTKKVFEKLLIWFHREDKLAQELFGNLYENRHKLRTDEEIIADIKFKQDVLNNANGYTEEDILNLVNTPKDKLFTLPENLSLEELQKIIEQYQNPKQDDNSELFTKTESIEETETTEIDIDNLLISLGISSLEDLEKAKSVYNNSLIGRCLSSIPRNYDYYSAFQYVQEIIQRSKDNIQLYLTKHPDYNCDNWYEESLTVINGILKKDRPIKLVVRPSDGGQVIIYYSEEYQALESPNTELWIDNSEIQRILTLGEILKYTGVNRIKIK